jgi:hypothetical protein
MFFMKTKSNNAISFRLTQTARDLLKAIAQEKGISATSAVEIAVRELAEREKIKLPD